MRADGQKRGHDGPQALSHGTLLSSGHVKSDNYLSDFAAARQSSPAQTGRFGDASSEPPSAIIIVTIECPKCGTRQQPEKPSYCETDLPPGVEPVSKLGLELSLDQPCSFAEA